jgi:predicted RNA-binding protein with RPS1 domain
MNVLQLKQAGREDAHQVTDSQRFRNGVCRTKSDPTTDCPTGPAAKKYSPPNVDKSPQMFNRHNSKTGLFGSHISEVTSTNADGQIKYLKVHQELKTPDEVSAGIYDDSTVGPAAISYRVNTENDLKFDQKHSQDENASLAQSYNKHDQMSVDGDSSQNVSHEHKNRLLVEILSQRLSPTAIVKPMPRRNSPPNVNKQTQSDRPVRSVTPFR